MAYFIVGLIVFGLLLLLAKLFVATDPRTLLRGLRYGLGGGLVFYGAVMVVAGRWGLGMGLIAAGISAIAFGRIGPIDLGSGSRSFGTASSVRSRFVRMKLDHDSGALTGEILQGAFAGRQLEDLGDADLLAFRDEAMADQESLALIEAYLDRRSPGWREHVQGDAAAGSRRAPDASSMTDQEAYQILGLAPGAREAEIRAAHRRLIKKFHPDQGGSSFLAARINEAKDRLLGNHHR